MAKLQAGTTVYGLLSATGVLYVSGGNSEQWNNAYTTANSVSSIVTNKLPLSGGTLTGGLTGTTAVFTSSISALNLSGTYYGDGSMLSNVNDSTKLLLTGGTINGNLTVVGNLTATGITTLANTVFSTTSALSVVNTSPVSGVPALYIGQSGPSDIASFYDIDQGIEILHIGGINSIYPNVGIKTSSPNKTLTVVGDISASSNIYAGGTFYGDGSNLTGVIKTQYTPPSNATFTSSVSAPSLSGTHYGDGSKLTGIISSLPAVATFTTSVSAPSVSGTYYGNGSKLTFASVNLGNNAVLGTNTFLGANTVVSSLFGQTGHLWTINGGQTYDYYVAQRRVITNFLWYASTETQDFNLLDNTNIFGVMLNNFLTTYSNANVIRILTTAVISDTLISTGAITYYTGGYQNDVTVKVQTNAQGFVGYTVNGTTSVNIANVLAVQPAAGVPPTIAFCTVFATAATASANGTLYIRFRSHNLANSGTHTYGSSVVASVEILGGASLA